MVTILFGTYGVATIDDGAALILLWKIQQRSNEDRYHREEVMFEALDLSSDQ